MFFQDGIKHFAPLVNFPGELVVHPERGAFQLPAFALYEHFLLEVLEFGDDGTVSVSSSGSESVNTVEGDIFDSFRWDFKSRHQEVFDSGLRIIRY